ncbi:MAG: hypothetical protein ACI8ZN_002010 [Bacteroidia bacterium]|jgi:hypothetical protein
MNKLKLLSIALFLSTALFAQNDITCVQKVDNDWTLYSFDANNQEYVNPILKLNSKYTKNTFTSFGDGATYAYSTFDGTSSSIHIVTEYGGEKKIFRQYEQILSLDYDRARAKLVYLSSRKSPNYYDFLVEDISITVLDLETSDQAKIQIPTFSILVPTIPYSGINNKKDQAGLNQNLDYHIGVPTIVQSEAKFMFVAKDIPGVTRLVSLDLLTHEVKTMALSDDVISITATDKIGRLKAMYYRQDGATTEMFVGNLNTQSGIVTNEVSLGSYINNLKVVNDGYLAYDHLNNVVYAIKFMNGFNHLIQLDPNSNVTYSKQTIPTDMDVRVAPMQPVAKTALANVVTSYPNPATNSVTVGTDRENIATHYTVVNLAGEVVKEIEVLGERLENSIDMRDLSEGMYFIRVTAGSEIAVVRFMKTN